MIPENSITEVISAADIVREIENSGVSLRRSGATLKGCCPFHDENTPSFIVYPNTQSFYCYGCATGGNVITFLMKKNNMEYIEAIRELAKRYGVDLNETKLSPKEVEKEGKKEVLRNIYKQAGIYYSKQLNGTAKEYALSRFNEDTLSIFKIGYASKQWHGLFDYLTKECGYKPEQLEKSELFRKNKNGEYFDFFRDRLIFPIFDLLGHIIAFSGRDLSMQDDVPKYLNSCETDLYKKKEVLYGMNFARAAIRKYDVCVVVEGNADVVKLHQLGVHNVVAACGTALSKEQIKIIERFTKNICLLYDCDAAGITATHRSAQLILEAGLDCSVIYLPKDENGQKRDPDNYINRKSEFRDIYTKYRKNYLLILAENKKDKCKDDPVYTSKTIKEICGLFYEKEDNEKAVLITELSKIIPSKSDWNKTIKELDREHNIVRKDKEVAGRTNEQNKSIERYSFYEQGNCYYFQHQKLEGVFFRGSNFVMQPLFHLASTYNAKRMYKLTNEFGYEIVIEFPQRDLISISAFKLKCESLGNFRFNAGEYGLEKIKGFLYEKTRTCFEITQLGWQKQGFWAWGNGSVSQGNFTPIDEFGIVQHNKENYYIPALSNFYNTDPSLFDFERKFTHNTGKVSLDEWLYKFAVVFGENALVGFSYYIATLFRDYIYSQFKFFPILNIFGPTGTGKSRMTFSMLQLFGTLPFGANLTNSTIAALADHVSKTSNAICHLEEYKNSIDYDKIEFLKGLWDGTGRSRMNMEKDRKKEVTAVDSGILLTGQEMPTADIALFNRVIFLSFTKDTFSDEETKELSELETLQREGLTQITNELLSYRTQFIENYKENLDLAHKELCKIVSNNGIESRLWQNWLVVIASFRTMHNIRPFPIVYEKMLHAVAPLIQRQHHKTKENNEISNFWDIFEYMVRTNVIDEAYHYKIYYEKNLKTDKYNSEGVKKVIAIDLKVALLEYSTQGKKSGQKVLPIDSIKYYLENSPEYLGIKSSRLRETTKNKNDKSEAVQLKNEKVQVSTHTVRCHYFDYERLNLDIEKSFELKEELNKQEDITLSS